ncbi:glycosyltransferase family 39 protein [Candidatus Sumerlaeota bacterium]|nr:glycosyltransferase family 39 protein [Candidatus Sumerlaeota bacterium]
MSDCNGHCAAARRADGVIRSGTLAALLLIGATLRLALLDVNPAGVFHDEAEKGYSAWSLARIGRVIDFTAPIAHEPGGEAYQTTRWPLFINVWGSHTSAIYQYAALPLIAAFGPNNWTLRLPAALAGTLTLLFCFLLIRELYDEKTAFIATVLLAFSPWHLVFSRWAAQGIFVPLFVCAGLWLLARGAKTMANSTAEGGCATSTIAQRHPAHWFGAAVCLGLAFYSYAGARPFLLLFFCWVAWLWRKELLAEKKWSVPAVALLALMTGFTLYCMLSGGGERMERFNRLSVFNQPGGVGLFLRNYLAHFSPLFLFFTGDAQPRHGLPLCGVMLHVELPLFLMGLWTLGKRRSREDLLLLGWFLLSPISAALTNEGNPHALRMLHAIPSTMAISAVGLSALREHWQKSRRQGAIQWLWRAALLNGIFVALILFYRYPQYSVYAYESGLREAIERADALGTQYAPDGYRIIDPLYGGYPPIPDLFYFLGHVEPEDALQDGPQASRFMLNRQYLRSGELARQLSLGDSVIIVGGDAVDPSLQGLFSQTGDKGLVVNIEIISPRNISAMNPPFLLFTLSPPENTTSPSGEK